VPLPITPEWQAAILDEVRRSALAGRGGAGFPAWRKMHAVRSAGRQPLLLVNAMEGEPASGKDQYLLASVPHLVLDGAELVALATGAERFVICIPAERQSLAARVGSALQERRSLAHPQAGSELRLLDGHYAAGEESALAAAVGGKIAVPRFRPDKSTPLSIGRRPVLVHNVETLAHVALIGRYGAEWFRQVGSPESPGTCLVTVSGAVREAGVFEVPTGTPVRDIVEKAQPSARVQAVLIGGYGGAWVAEHDLSVPFAPGSLKQVGAGMGAGVLVVLPVGACGLQETQRVVGYMAGESVGQCGPCMFGLPAIADDLSALVRGHARAADLERLRSRCGLVDGRGACRHPDGVARLVRSALDIFSDDLSRHLDGGHCAGCDQAAVLTVPGTALGFGTSTTGAAA
jgi:NADH:ubiquinone oxidoreductase subunit F (NADH-binding)